MYSRVSRTDLEILDQGYEIAKYMRSFYKDNAWEEDGRIPRFACNFPLGPDARVFQTAQGFILSGSPQGPCELHTPLGTWQIVGGGVSESEERVKAILGQWQNKLGLKIGRNSDDDVISQIAAITEWKGRSIALPQYKEASQYLSQDTVETLWQRWLSEHQEMRRPEAWYYDSTPCSLPQILHHARPHSSRYSHHNRQSQPSKRSRSPVDPDVFHKYQPSQKARREDRYY